MKAKAKVNFKAKAVKRAVRRGAQKGLKGAAAEVWSRIRRNIPRRKHKASRPGRPPHDHRTFKQSVRYAVDETELAAYIGPQRIAEKPENPGGPAPATLEFGGTTAKVPNPAWFRKIKPGDPPMTTIAQVADYFLGKGYGPLFLSQSKSQVVSQAKASGRAKAGEWEQHIRHRKNLITGRTVFFLSVPLKSRKMAERAARNAVREFGFPTVRQSRVEPRPVMGPTLEDTKSVLASYFANTVQ